MRKKWISIMLCMCLFLSACSAGKNATNVGETVMSNSSGMGRYMETISNFAERMPDTLAIGNVGEASCYVLDKKEGLYQVSKEGPYVTKETMVQREKLKGMETKYEISNAAIAPNGDSAIVYYDTENVTTTEDSINSIEYQYLIVGIDGESRELTLPNQLRDGGVTQFWYKGDGTLYGTSYQGKVYEINTTDNTYQLVFDYGSLPGHISFKNDIMILINAGGIFFYDLEKNAWIEDQTANEFIQKECKWETLTDNQYNILAFPGEGDAIYIACEKGLYRYAIGGNVMEQVIDGTLCSLGDRSQRLMGMVQTGEKEFAALHYGGKLSYYHYDSEVPTLPEKVLKVYSLRENLILKQTLHAYQAQNPDVFVKVEVGLTDNSGVTREDAIKLLNTQIMAGEGPDLMILDELPVDSYIQKGILKDITTILEKAEQEEAFFTNITHMYQTGEGIFAVPTLNRMTYIMGDKEKVDKVQDLKGLADMVEELRAENPESDIIGLYNEKNIIKTLALGCAPAWKTETGEINKENIAEFLEQAKRIYDVQMQTKHRAGYVEECEAWETKMQEQKAHISNYGDYTPEMAYMGLDFQKGTFACNYSKMFVAYTDCCLGYSNFPSLQKYWGDERELSYKVFAGQSKNVFFPYSVMGINQKSEQQELAEEFLRMALSKEIQNSMEYGFPVNKDSLQAKINKEVGIYFAAAPTGMSPDPYQIYVEWASKDEFANLVADIEKADTPYVSKDMLETVLLEIGPKALNGELSIDNAVQEIISRAGIYLTE